MNPRQIGSGPCLSLSAISVDLDAPNQLGSLVVVPRWAAGGAIGLLVIAPAPTPLAHGWMFRLCERERLEAEVPK